MGDRSRKGLLVQIPRVGTILGVLFSLAALLPFPVASAPAEETAPLLSDSDGMEHYSLGTFYEASDNYLDAAREYRMAAALAPTSAEIHASLARVLLRLHEVEEAKKSAEQALRIDPKNVEALGVMVQIDVGLRDLSGAADRLRAILEENPSDDASRMLLADLLERDGRIADAAREMQIVVDHIPGSAMMHFRLGNLHAQLGKTEDAVREYEAALQIDPGLLEALARSGIARETEGQLGEAAKIYRRAVDASPTDLRIGKRLLRVLLLLDDSAEARKEAERLLALAPDDVEVREQYALLLLRSGDSEGALRELQRVEKEAPDRLSTHKHLGRYYWDRDRPQEALAQYRTVVSIDSTFVEGWVLRGYLELRVGSAEDALASFRKASELESDEPTLAFYEGVSLSELKRFDEAVPAFDRALAMNPNYAEASFARGVALDRMGRTRRRRGVVSPRTGDSARQRPGDELPRIHVRREGNPPRGSDRPSGEGRGDRARGRRDPGQHGLGSVPGRATGRGQALVWKKPCPRSRSMPWFWTIWATSCMRWEMSREPGRRGRGHTRRTPRRRAREPSSTGSAAESSTID